MTGAYPLGCQAMTVAPVSVTAPVRVSTSMEAASPAPQDPVRARLRTQSQGSNPAPPTVDTHAHQGITPERTARQPSAAGCARLQAVA